MNLNLNVFYAHNINITNDKKKDFILRILRKFNLKFLILILSI